MLFKDYLLQNWALILVLMAFSISLSITVFLEKKAVHRLYVLNVIIFLLSIVVFLEFNLLEPQYKTFRLILMAIRYSSTPLIVSLITFALVKKQRWFVFIPAIILAIIDIISIFTGIVFAINDNNELQRGPLGYLPFIVAGLYFVFLIYLLIHRSNKRAMEIIPIVFLALAFTCGLVFPFIFGNEFSQIFVTTIGISLFVYYEFSFLQLTKKDALTGLLNRQAYYVESKADRESITALLSIDMNGLKVINDTKGHAAGDEALVTLSLCFLRSLKRRQSGYRIGGDEFIILCRKASEVEVVELVKRIRENVAETPYSCSIGYSFSEDRNKPIEDMLKESDEMMYAEKQKHYEEEGNNRRAH